MTIKKIAVLVLILAGLWIQNACKKDCEEPPEGEYNPTYVNLTRPEFFPPIEVPADNPLTKEGINLGRMLFYDPILSGDSTLACAGCHNQAFGFTDDAKQFSTGIDGLEGDRNAMAIFNLVWGRGFFWDGRASSIEEQASQPVPNPIEMHEEWVNVEQKLLDHADYPQLFFDAFGIDTPSEDLATKALAQFMRTILTYNSRYDKHIRGELLGTGQELTESEERGMIIFFNPNFGDPDGAGDCFHCHGNILFQDVSTNGQYRNNGLQAAATIYDFPDPGRGEVTQDPDDYGKFKVPTLRNIALTGPYMHDGRFQTLEEVVEFYNSGMEQSPTVDGQMEAAIFGGLFLTEQQKTDLVNFLKTLTDEEFADNPDYANPF